MIKYLIIDDEFIAHEIIKGYCDLLPNFELSKSCNDAIEALEYLSKNRVDLLFLDLNMPKLKGFEFLRTLQSPPKVIVTTAYKDFAIEGYELNVVDYLLKPFSFERFLKAVNKAIVSNTNPGASFTSEKKEKHIFLRSSRKYIQVAIDDILYIEAAGNYSKVILPEKTVVIREKISDLKVSLPSDQFVQVHKSFLVAKNHIGSIEGNRILVGNQNIPIGNIYKLNIAEMLKS